MPKRTHNSTPSGTADDIPVLPPRIVRERSVVVTTQIEAGYLPEQAARIAEWFIPFRPPRKAGKGARK